MVDHVMVDKLRLVKPEQADGLQQLSGSVFQRKGEAVVLQEIENPRVIQGYVESSNVNVVDQYMEMIMLERMYGLNAKIISTRDGNLARAMEMGKATQ